VGGRRTSRRLGSKWLCDPFDPTPKRVLDSLSLLSSRSILGLVARHVKGDGSRIRQERSSSISCSYQRCLAKYSLVFVGNMPEPRKSPSGIATSMSHTSGDDGEARWRGRGTLGLGCCVGATFLPTKGIIESAAERLSKPSPGHPLGGRKTALGLTKSLRSYSSIFVTWHTDSKEHHFDVISLRSLARRRSS
jgi:hypothetical protein